MAILLIRHGETLGNRNRVVQTPDIALSEHGIAQAARLARRLESSPIVEIWTSPQTRARMTAAAIERATGLEAREHTDLEERSFGAIRGTPYSELGFDLMAHDYDPPEGESWSVFHERVDRIWAEVEQRWLEQFVNTPEPRHLVLVSHGLVCRSLIERRLLPDQALDDHRDEGGRVQLRNTALTIIEPRVKVDRIVEYEVPLVGCVAHLDADEPAALGAV
jgi:broad specificity phosphatase PhoE